MVGLRSTALLAFCRGLLALVPGVAAHPDDARVVMGDETDRAEGPCQAGAPATVATTEGVFVTHGGDTLLFTGGGVTLARC